MSIGVFGDSFAQDHREAVEWIRSSDFFYDSRSNKAAQEAIHKVKEEFPGWFNLLPDAKAYGIGGGDNYVSLLTFLTEHEKYDQVIFVLTNFRRHSIWTSTNKVMDFNFPDDRGTANELTCWLHATNFDQCKKHSDKPNPVYAGNKDHIRKFKIMKEYHQHIQDPSEGHRDEIFSALILDYILKVRPDTMFVHAFQDYEPEQYRDMIWNPPKVNSLFDIYRYENELLRARRPGQSDMRIAHMSTESNRILAQQIKKQLDAGVRWFDPDITEFKQKVKSLDAARYFCDDDDRAATRYLHLQGIRVPKLKRFVDR